MEIYGVIILSDCRLPIVCHDGFSIVFNYCMLHVFIPRNQYSGLKKWELLERVIIGILCKAIGVEFISGVSVLVKWGSGMASVSFLLVGIAGCFRTWKWLCSYNLLPTSGRGIDWPPNAALSLHNRILFSKLKHCVNMHGCKMHAMALVTNRNV